MSVGFKKGLLLFVLFYLSPFAVGSKYVPCHQGNMQYLQEFSSLFTQKQPSPTPRPPAAI